jgi:hypothetical protein
MSVHSYLSDEKSQTGQRGEGSGKEAAVKAACPELVEISLKGRTNCGYGLIYAGM